MDSSASENTPTDSQMANQSSSESRSKAQSSKSVVQSAIAREKIGAGASNEVSLAQRTN